MKASLSWLNDLLSPGGLSADAIEHALTFAGLPIESATPVAVPSGASDTCLDVEVTSNRGDCLAHAGLAREIAAASGGVQTLRDAAPALPAPTPTGEDIASAVTLRNDVPDLCKRFTLTLIRGVKVGPSPAWLVDRLAAIGQRSINNVIDATNFVLAEMGAPSHVFDLARLSRDSSGKAAIVVRKATQGEKLALFDGTDRPLRAGDLVVADAGAPVSLAGIMGGSATGVSAATSDVLLEVATWNPVAIRTTARRLAIRTDSSFRFERVVDPRTIDEARQRLVSLIVAIAGGKVCPGVLDDTGGSPLSDAPTIPLRTQRVRDMLGADVSDDQINAALRVQGFAHAGAGASAGATQWRSPSTRTDQRLEIDLIEEVARTVGYDKIPAPDVVSVRVGPLQGEELAMRELGRVLTGAGFFETITFSFVTKAAANLFSVPGAQLMSVGDDKRGSENILRPSVLPSLLECRKRNQDARATVDGGIRLFETSSTFYQLPAEASAAERRAQDGLRGASETRVLSMLADLPATGTNHERRQQGVRLIRGVIDTLAQSLHGPDARLSIIAPIPAHAAIKGLDPAASAMIQLGDRNLGIFGIVSPAAQSAFDLAAPVMLAELNLATLLAGYPPRTRLKALPQFPVVERDLSLILAESVTWHAVESCVLATRASLLEDVRFVTTFRGKPIPESKKSVSLRMTFREPTRTLRDEEVNAQVDAIVQKLRSDLKAELRDGGKA
ncbi:MAG: phenylalanine--tRNA ligase subunit beta [Phycisphaerales bacterium]